MPQVGGMWRSQNQAKVSVGECFSTVGRCWLCTYPNLGSFLGTLTYLQKVLEIFFPVN